MNAETPKVNSRGKIVTVRRDITRTNDIRTKTESETDMETIKEYMRHARR